MSIYLHRYEGIFLVSVQTCVLKSFHICGSLVILILSSEILFIKYRLITVPPNPSIPCHWSCDCSQ